MAETKGADMAKFDKNTVQTWADDCAAWLENRHKLKLVDIKTGRDAWAVAHQTGVTREAYSDRSVTDGHIQTALESIFPNAVFNDRKAY